MLRQHEPSEPRAVDTRNQAKELLVLRWLCLSPSANTERQSEFGMNIGNTSHSSSAPRPIPAPSELNRWDLSEILNPSSSAPAQSRDRKMSLDFSAKASQPQHGLYGQPDLDQSFNIPSSENVNLLYHSFFQCSLKTSDRQYGWRRSLKL